LFISGCLLPLRLNFKNKKTSTMKKVFAMMAIASVMVACNNDAEKKAEEGKDTAAAKMQEMVDTSAAKMQNLVDTAASKMNNIVDTSVKK
jgi:ketopantoate reductase